MTSLQASFYLAIFCVIVAETSCSSLRAYLLDILETSNTYHNHEDRTCNVGIAAVGDGSKQRYWYVHASNCSTFCVHDQNRRFTIFQAYISDISVCSLEASTNLYDSNNRHPSQLNSRCCHSHHHNTNHRLHNHNLLRRFHRRLSCLLCCLCGRYNQCSFHPLFSTRDFPVLTPNIHFLRIQQESDKYRT